MHPNNRSNNFFGGRPIIFIGASWWLSAPILNLNDMESVTTMAIKKSKRFVSYKLKIALIFSCCDCLDWVYYFVGFGLHHLLQVTSVWATLKNLKCVGI